MKRFVTIMITAALLSAVPCFADEVYIDAVTEDAALESYASGTYYEEWNVWFDKSTGRITGYDGTGSSLTLPAEIDGTAVVGIADQTFSGSGLKSIKLPESLTLIGYKAFENCTELTEVTIPKNVTETKTSSWFEYYGNWFVGCTSLKKVTFENGTAAILREALANSSVTEVILPESVTQIGYQAFANMKGLKSIKLPESLTSIGESAFSGCTSLESIEVPKYTAKIYDTAFKDCSSLKSVSLGGGLATLGYKAFENCTALTEMTIPKNVTETKTSSWFEYYGNWFVGCTSLKKVTFENGTAAILREALANSSVTEVILPESVTQIGYQAFANMKGLKSIKLPESLTSIGESAFSGCTSLESIEVPKYTAKIYDTAFKDCSSLKSVSLGGGLATLGYKAFENCTELTEMTIPKNVTETKTSSWFEYYGNWFVGCTSLKKVTFENGTETILREALANSAVTEVVLPESVTQIGYQAFANMKGLKSIKLPESLEGIGGEAFSGCTSLEGIRVPNNTETIIDGAFKGCSSLKEVSLGSGLVTLGYKSFENCVSLRTMVIPKNVTKTKTSSWFEYYGNWFVGCTSLNKVTFEAGTTEILREALANSYVSTAELPDSIETIGREAFANCVNIKTISIPEKVNNIANGAFSGCSKLEKAQFRGDAPEITGVGSSGITVFKGCYADFEINYLKGKDGWTEPEWNGYPCRGTDAYMNNDEPEGVYGDADNDGTLTASDSAEILQKVLKGSFKTEMEKEIGETYLLYLDVDGNGELTASDSAIVLQKVLNGSFKMPVEE